MNPNAIEVKNLIKVYKEKTAAPVRALDGLSLQVRKGEIFGLLGKNGAGKTTLLRILTTLIPPTEGTATILGMDVVQQELEVRRNICVVLQENAVELFLSVEDNLDTYARFHSIPREDRKKRMDKVIAQFGLGEHRKAKVIDLSGGLKRRVQVAKVFMVGKPVVFLDEATTGMDPINKRATIEAIKEEAIQGRTIFLTTHILQEAEELCDTIAIIDRGKLVASGNLQAIKSLALPTVELFIAFDKVDEEILSHLRVLPHLKLAHTATTVELSLRGVESSALEAIARISKTHTINHLEVNNGTLEDVFFELLSQDAASSERGAT